MKDTLWYKDAIIYETHVRTFYDSNEDGVGDFPGIIQKLDYLQELGINCLWLLPFYPSPLRDDGYDISSYKGINPMYGDMRDFRNFVREAHRRGIRVMTELVINHTSDQHPWFQAARTAPRDSVKRNFYVWSDKDQEYSKARIIFTDSEKSNWTWDPVAKAYYWHRFFHHQPDLNFDNPAVLRKIKQVLRFWMEKGVDALRLDAVPYLVERANTNCENLPETHLILKEIRKHIDANFEDRVLLAEANQWPEDVRPYFGSGDECHMAYHFPLMPRIFMALRQEDRHPITDILRQTPEIPDSCQWALFLRNHDELTLEMVTNEERDYMYKAYAADTRMRINLGIRRRLAPLMDNSRRRIELLTSLLFSLPGTPIIYYGDEIGMGDNVYIGDRNGVRTPMQWNSDRNAGFSRADFAKLYCAPIMDSVYGYQAINVEAQLRDPSSLLNWMKRMTAIRNKFKTFGRGTMEILLPSNRKILAYTRKYQEETILCVANLSRFVQPAELDLFAYSGMTPVEMFGRIEFPRISENPYFLTVAPHSFYWFQLQKVPDTISIHVSPEREEVESLPVLEISATWDMIGRKNFSDEAGQKILPRFLQRQRWFSGKARKLESLQVLDRIFLDTGRPVTYLNILQAEFSENDKHVYSLPLTILSAESNTVPMEYSVARIRSASGEGILCDAMQDDVVCEALFWFIARESISKGRNGHLKGICATHFTDAKKSMTYPIKMIRSLGEQSNTSVVFGDLLILKLFRRLHPGLNPEYEILRFLNEKTTFDRVPKLAGIIEYQQSDKESSIVAVLETMVQNQGSAWNHTLDELSRFFERVLSVKHSSPPLHGTPFFLDLADTILEPSLKEIIGTFLEEASLIGKRTAELHLALSSREEDAAFRPEPIDVRDLADLVKNFQQHGNEALGALERNLDRLSEDLRAGARSVISRRDELISPFEILLSKEISLSRIRVHGDYHLGQLLWVKNDFVIIDFEGEPARSISERRIKQSVFKDVASMLRSFSYAANAALFSFTQDRPGELDFLKQYTRAWQSWISIVFLRGYLDAAQGATFLPRTREQLRMILTCFMLDKVLYELDYELNNRPDWVRIPLAGIQDLLELRVSQGILK